MKFFMYLPRNKKEFALFLLLVSVISVNIIAPIITSFEVGFSFQTWKSTLKVLPFIWLVVVVLVILTNAPATWMKDKIVAKGDSFNAHIIVNVLCNVLMMSIILTVVGAWIGQGQLSLDPITDFAYRWPRNFAVSFAVELLIAQPIARQVLYLIHSSQETASN
ncbi:hypothetical protein [Secundilactobacillus malefermentans]|uniref:hypothetical protein n=1 Tax=Secundilactobacillus malefermentans TaxID=176292 RepID=UPI0011CCBA2C|nr:hypothetical protein [Secundilactobacillus malefermentans]QEA31728.1 hypothetical protein FGL90_05775 [Secundilactobacillus malefermentans]